MKNSLFSTALILLIGTGGGLSLLSIAQPASAQSVIVPTAVRYTSTGTQYRTDFTVKLNDDGQVVGLICATTWGAKQFLGKPPDVTTTVYVYDGNEPIGVFTFQGKVGGESCNRFVTKFVRPLTSARFEFSYR